MPPTINSNPAVETDKRPPRLVERKSDLICRVKYTNTLPDIPSDLKFLQYPFDSHRFVQYNPTSLERNYKYEVLTEHDLGVTIDLINRDLYQTDPYDHLDPADEKLLEEDVHMPHDSVRSKQHSRSVSWLRKSEYISTEQTRFQPQNLENIEAKVGYNVKKSLREETLYLDRAAQIIAIEKTFAESKKEILKHYSKPNVVPVDVFPVYPDFKNWKFPCAQVIFDSDPAAAGKSLATQEEEMSQAMIRGVMDQSGEQFVAYFLPTEETLEKRRKDAQNQIPYKDDEEYEYRIAREYNWNVKSKTSKGYEENYFFVIRPDGVFYNELETRVRLNKRRLKVGHQPSNTKLVVKHRSLDAVEHRMQRYRERVLEALGEEEEEEEEEIDTIMENDLQGNGPNEETTVGEAKKHEIRNVTHQSSEVNAANDASELPRNHSHSKTPEKEHCGTLMESKSRTRSRSPMRSRSRTRSSSGSGDFESYSGSRSRSHSSSGSVKSKRSANGYRSPSRSPSAIPKSSGKQRSPPRSPSRNSNVGSQRSGSESSDFQSPSQSPSRSRSPSHSRSHPRSPSGSHSPSQPRSPSAFRSRSGSVSRSPVSPSAAAATRPADVESGSSISKYRSSSRSPPRTPASDSPNQSSLFSECSTPSYSPSRPKYTLPNTGEAMESELGGSDAEE